MPEQLFAKFVKVIRPEIGIDYDFYIFENSVSKPDRERFWDLVALSPAELELFKAIMTHTGEKAFEVSPKQVVIARMLNSYGLIRYQESRNPVERFAIPTRIGLLIYEYSFVRDMQTVDELEQSKQEILVDPFGF